MQSVQREQSEQDRYMRKPRSSNGDARSGATNDGRLPALLAQIQHLAPHVEHDDFGRRVWAVAFAGVEREWTTRSALKTEAKVAGWNRKSRMTYDEARLSVEELARRLDNISVSKLERELRRLNLGSPGFVIRIARLLYAKQLLRETRLLIREIAERSGYATHKQFSSAFVRAFSVTPQQYRQQLTPNPLPPSPKTTNE